MGKVLNIEYAASHAAYWMYYGVIASFSSAFLLEKGYSNSDIGIILAAASVISAVIQPVMADIADRSRRLGTLGVLDISAVFMLVLGIGLFVYEKSIMLWTFYVLITAVLMALQPLLNALPKTFEKSGSHVDFGMCRAGGSFAYAALMLFLGTMVESLGEGILPITAQILLVTLLIVFLVSGKSFKKALTSRDNGAESVKLTGENQTGEDGEDINLIEFVRRNRLFTVLNLGLILLFFQNYIANNFMLQIVEGVGGDAADMGRIFSVMAFLEIPTMFFYDKIRKRFDCRLLLKIAAISFVLKFAIIYIANSVAVIYAAHILQLTGFGLFLPAMVDFTGSIMAKGEEVKGQALYTTCITISSVFASLMGGLILDAAGAKAMVLVATVIAILGTLVVFAIVDKIKYKA